MSYVANLKNARIAASKSYGDLSKALQHVKPVTPEMHALFITKPDAYADMLRKVADILVTIPTLQASYDSAKKILAELEALACYRCDGSGQYSGPTNATRNGVPYCFYCNGTGKAGSKAKKK
jgi:hypothetical protein